MCLQMYLFLFALLSKVPSKANRYKEKVFIKRIGASSMCLKVSFSFFCLAKNSFISILYFKL